MPNDQQDWTSVIARPQTQLVGSPYTVASGTDTRTFTLAPDTSIIMILIPNFFNVTSLQVHGVTSGFTYIKAQPDLTSYHPYYTGVISAAVDTQVSITVSVGASTTIYISSVPDAVATLVMPNQAAPWESPNQPPLTVDFGNPGPAGTSVIIPAPSNAQSIYLHSFEWVWNATSATLNGVWQDDSGLEIGAEDITNNVAPRFMDWKGAKMAGGRALRFKQNGALAAGTVFCNGTICYSIY